MNGEQFVVEELEDVGLERAPGEAVDNEADVVGVGSGENGVEEHVEHEVVVNLRAEGGNNTHDRNTELSWRGYTVNP